VTSRIDVIAATLADIAAMREVYRQEMRCQIVHDSWHARRFTELFRLQIDGRDVGYGAVGGAPGEPRELVKELYLVPSARPLAAALFTRLVEMSGARAIEAQTNDPLLSEMLDAHAALVTSETVLFEAGVDTSLTALDVSLRPIRPAEKAGVFPHRHEPVGDWGLERDGAIVATGGLLFHYNPPFADLYMEVEPSFRRRGYGAYLVQALKQRCDEAGHVPAARCRADNLASRRTLERAGLRVCGRIVRGWFRASAAP